jgi:putative transcriptional regulator
MTIDSKSGARMRAIRRALGMTQRDFAYFLRVAVPTVSNWETGRTKPSGLAQSAIRNVAVDHGLDLNTMRRFA